MAVSSGAMSSMFDPVGIGICLTAMELILRLKALPRWPPQCRRVSLPRVPVTND